MNPASRKGINRLEAAFMPAAMTMTAARASKVCRGLAGKRPEGREAMAKALRDSRGSGSLGNSGDKVVTSAVTQTSNPCHRTDS